MQASKLKRKTKPKSKPPRGGQTKSSLRLKVQPMQNLSGACPHSIHERVDILAKFGDFKSFQDKKFEFKIPRSAQEVGDVDGQAPMSDTPSIAKALFDPLAVYPFKITQTGQFSSSAGGNILTNTFWNPAGLTEYGYLISLFSLVRVRRVRLQLTPINPHADGYATGRVAGVIFAACDYGLSGTNPASTQQVIDCPNLLVVSLGSERTHVLDTPLIDNEYAATVTPAPGPYAGCFGQFSFAASGLTVSTLYVQWTLECVYEFTSRT